MRIFLPNSATLQNVSHFIRSLDTSDPETLAFSMHPRWVAIHPVVLAMTACAAAIVRADDGTVTGQVRDIATLPYLMRMGLFNELDLPTPRTISEHEASGRFIPITRISNSLDLESAITNLIPLLHTSREVADPIKYVISELVRNSLEHARSSVGAYVCAQYYAKSGRVAIGIADGGIGILGSMRHSYLLDASADAIALSLMPGITGTTKARFGTKNNAGLGLFFTKSIAGLSRNYFMVYSGDAAYRLRKTSASQPTDVRSNPLSDNHDLWRDLPSWPGTVVGIDVSLGDASEFAGFLDIIRVAYHQEMKRQSDHTGKIRFS